MVAGTWRADECFVIIRMMFRRNTQQGFAIVEIVIVIIFVVLLAAVVFYSVNAQPKDTGNDQRRADVNAILRAIEQYEYKYGTLPQGIAAMPKLIASTPGDVAVDLCPALAPEFMPTIPLDPSEGLAVPVGELCTNDESRYNSGYTVQVDTEKRVTVSAPAAQGGQQIFARN